MAAVFRGYLRACIPAGPACPLPLADARSEAVLAETLRIEHLERD
ncbi:hypothetical protein [Streptomyces sp. SID13666]|nr:hypothetical protein [Streptomyces sp. SID13666]MCZ4103072.1 hypothetical protein [Streptomyces sp. H39-C1]